MLLHHICINVVCFYVFHFFFISFPTACFNCNFSTMNFLWCINCTQVRFLIGIRFPWGWMWNCQTVTPMAIPAIASFDPTTHRNDITILLIRQEALLALLSQSSITAISASKSSPGSPGGTALYMGNWLRAIDGRGYLLALGAWALSCGTGPLPLASYWYPRLLLFGCRVHHHLDLAAGQGRWVGLRL